MFRMFERWYRWLTNPCPGPGQAWRLQGVGPVFVRSVRWTSHPPVVELSLANGEPLDGWRLSHFREQATLSANDEHSSRWLADLQIVDGGR